MLLNPFWRLHVRKTTALKLSIWFWFCIFVMSYMVLSCSLFTRLTYRQVIQLLHLLCTSLTVAHVNKSLSPLEQITWCNTLIKQISLGPSKNHVTGEDREFVEFWFRSRSVTKGRGLAKFSIKDSAQQGTVYCKIFDENFHLWVNIGPGRSRGEGLGSRRILPSTCFFWTVP